MSRAPLSADARRVVAAQALRAFAYGFGALLLGTTLKRRGFSSTEVGVVLGAVVAGTIVSSLAVARWSDQVGRRRCYVVLYLLLGVSGAVFALSGNLVLLLVVALTGALSTDIVDNGPFTSLEQAMLATELGGAERIRGFGLYNAVAAAAGSLGALAAGVPALLRTRVPSLPADQRFFLVFVPVALAGAAVAGALSPSIEAPVPAGRRTGRTRLGPSKPTVVRLAALFATDAFGGGFVVQAFIAYWFSVKFHTSVGLLGLMFFAIVPAAITVKEDQNIGLVCRACPSQACRAVAALWLLDHGGPGGLRHGACAIAAAVVDDDDLVDEIAGDGPDHLANNGGFIQGRDNGHNAHGVSFTVTSAPYVKQRSNRPRPLWPVGLRASH